MDSRLQRSSCNFEACRENADAEQRVIIINIKIIIRNKIFHYLCQYYRQKLQYPRHHHHHQDNHYPCHYHHDYLAYQAGGGERFSGLLQHRTRDLVVTP